MISRKISLCLLLQSCKFLWYILFNPLFIDWILFFVSFRYGLCILTLDFCSWYPCLKLGHAFSCHCCLTGADYLTAIFFFTQVLVCTWSNSKWSVLSLPCRKYFVVVCISSRINDIGISEVNALMILFLSRKQCLLVCFYNLVKNLVLLFCLLPNSYHYRQERIYNSKKQLCRKLRGKTICYVFIVSVPVVNLLIQHFDLSAL
jgi:hypothetical protein